MVFDSTRESEHKGRLDAAVMVETPSFQTEDAGVVVDYETSEFAANGKDGGNRLVGFLTSFVAGNGSKAKGPVELDDMSSRKNVDEVKIVHSPDRSLGAVGGFDVCREYSYTADDDDDDADFEGSLISDPSSQNSSRPPLSAFVLGKSYRMAADFNLRRDDESSLFWFTYRCDFPEIVPYNVRSDAGWGCMLRSAQMLLGQALRMHFKSRDWRPPQHCSARRTDPFTRSILTWFADFPSTDQCYYSLHNMVATGLRYDKLPGEWYGPGTACHVLRDLVEMHERRQQQSIQTSKEAQQVAKPKRIFRVHVASHGTVYRDAVYDLMTRESKAKFVRESEKKHKVTPQAHPLDMEWEDELVEEVGKVEWDTGLLLLIPVRLGLDRFNGDYVRAVAHTFSFSQSVGVLGGRVRGARWFFGAVSDGSKPKVFGLDPHTVQNAPRSRSARINGKVTSTVDLRDDYIISCHTKYSEVLSLEKMDPSIAFGFYCRDQTDFENLLSSIQTWKTENPGHPELFSVADSSPNYFSSGGLGDSMLDSSMLDDESDKDDNKAVPDEEEDDEDFVLL